MRKILLVLLSILLTGTVAAASNVTFSDKTNHKTPETLGVNIADVPTYGIKKHTHDAAKATNRANKVFASNPVASNVRNIQTDVKDKSDATIYKRGNVYFEISKNTGAEILIDLDKYTKAAKTPRTLRDETLRSAAKKYITTHIPDVNANELGAVKIKKIMNGSANTEENKEPSNIKTEIANYIVVFERKKGVIPFVGPGEQIRVYYSSDGNVVGHSKIWRAISDTPSSKRPVKASKDIKEKFKAKHGSAPEKSVSVEELWFGYLANGRYSEQTETSPVYAIGYKTGPDSKMTFELYDAYTGDEISLPANEDSSDTRTTTP